MTKINQNLGPRLPTDPHPITGEPFISGEFTYKRGFKKSGDTYYVMDILKEGRFMTESGAEAEGFFENEKWYWTQACCKYCEIEEPNNKPKPHFSEAHIKAIGEILK